MRVTLPKSAHCYDLRAHKYLGEKQSLTAILREADPKLYALLPYQVKGIKVAVTGGRRPGEALKYNVKLNVGAAKPARHVVKVEVFSPDGGKSLRKALPSDGKAEPHTLYSTNLDTRAGAGSGQFRLALNDAPGAWRLVVTDVISGAKAEATWKVR